MRHYPTDTVRGLRDRALIVVLLVTARRCSDVRMLRWEDILIDSQTGRTQCRWENREGDNAEMTDLSPAVGELLTALRSSLEQLHAIDDTTPVFTALTDNARRLPGVEDSGTQQPLTEREYGRIVKHYARRAGLDPAKVSLSVLRHTAGKMREKLGDSPASICRLLNLASPRATRLYLDRLDRHNKGAWARLDQFIGL